MKKFIFCAIVLVMVACMVACNNSVATEPTTETQTEAATEIHTEATTEISTTTDAPTEPKLSSKFINTSLQFINEYSEDNSTKKFGNLATEAILLSNDFRGELYGYLNNHYLPQTYSESSFYMDGDGIKNIYVYIYNYRNGFFQEFWTFDDYEHSMGIPDSIIISCGILGKEYPDNIKLAVARIAAYVVLQMDMQDIEQCCIIQNEEGKYRYDFTFENEIFKEKAREILVSLLE